MDRRDEILQAIKEHNGVFTTAELIAYLRPTGYGEHYIRRIVTSLKNDGQIRVTKRKLRASVAGPQRTNTRMLRSVVRWGNEGEIEACRRGLMALRTIEELESLRVEIDTIIQFIMDPYELTPSTEADPFTEHDFSWLSRI